MSFTPKKKRRAWRSVKRYVKTELANISHVSNVSESNDEVNYDCVQETMKIPKNSGARDDEIRMPDIRLRPATESDELATQYRDDLQFEVDIPSCHSNLVSGHNVNNNPSNLKSFLAK